MKKIPLTLITGFLGAGKSTLINRILREKDGHQFGLVVNEFGDVKLESQIVEASEEDLVELSNGCMCCVVRGDLIKTVDGLLNRKKNLQHILIEASGLSDPLPIAQTFLADDLGGKIRFDAILCLVDALNFKTNLDNFAVAVNQLKWSDFVIITKTDLIDPADLPALLDLVKAMAPKAIIYNVEEEALIDLVLDISQTDHSDLKSLQYEERSRLSPLTLDDGPPSGANGKNNNGKFKKVQKVHPIHEDVDTYFYRSSQPFDFMKVGKLLDRLPKEIVRAKGFLYLNTAEGERLKVVYQMVAQRSGLNAKSWNPGEERQSALVFIGKKIDKPFLKHLLDSSLALEAVH